MMGETFPNIAANLSDQAQRLYASLDSIAPLFATSKIARDFQTSLLHAERAIDLLKQLPLEWESARWILWQRSNTLRATIYGSQRHLMFPPDQLKPEQALALQSAIAQGQTLIKTFIPLAEEIKVFATSTETQRPLGTPFSLVHEIVGPYLLYDMQPASLTIRLSPDADAAPVIFHPFLTFNILNAVVIGIARFRPAHEHLTMQVLAERRHFEVRFAIHGFRLTPTLWQMFENSLDAMHYNVQYRRDLGCELEPLTWDEGQGEGIIACLTW